MLLKRSSTTQQSPFNPHDFAIRIKVTIRPQSSWKQPFRRTGPPESGSQYPGLQSRLSKQQWSLSRTDSSLLPNVLRGAECQEQGRRAVLEAQSPASPKEARGGHHQSYTGKGTWLQSSDHQSTSSRYFLGFSRMFRNFPLVISLDSSNPSW